jgi:hypothetical protein
MFPLLLLALMLRRRHRYRRRVTIPSTPIPFLKLSVDEQLARFRVTLAELDLLAQRLKLPAVVVTRSRVAAPREIALQMVCFRLAHWSRVEVEMVTAFARSPAAISEIISTTVHLILSRFEGHLMWHPRTSGELYLMYL